MKRYLVPEERQTGRREQAVLERKTQTHSLWIFIGLVWVVFSLMRHLFILKVALVTSLNLVKQVNLRMPRINFGNFFRV